MSLDRALIAILDKADPPAHAFVDGFLADALPRATGQRVYLLTERSGQAQPYRYGRAICVPVLAPRRGWRRLLNVVLVALAVRRLSPAAREAQRGDILVRNDPLNLLGCAFVRRRANAIVFQSSFPHEESNPSPTKRLGARLLMRLTRRLPDALLAVSPLGMERIMRLFPGRPALSIPVLAGPLSSAQARSRVQGSPVQFLYLGSHDPQRELPLVLGAIVDAHRDGLDASFTFLGGTEEQLAELKALPGVGELIESGRLRLLPQVPRPEALRHLETADVGLSMIPPRSFYREASPTKLAEYFQAGLAVVASDGIQMQSDWLTASQAGKLVPWDQRELATALRELVEEPATLEQMQLKARAFADAELDYRAHVGAFLDLLARAAGSGSRPLS